MKQIVILLLIVGSISCSGKRTAAKTAENKFVIEKLSTLNSKEVAEIYKDANIKEDIGVYEEGTEERPYTILYPGTPDEIEITWKDSKRTKINDIRFNELGQWRSSKGIKIGTNYEELNRINNKPIEFYGFGWDYSGAVDWNGGELENSNLRVFLAPQNGPPEKFYGDQIVKASPEEIRNLNLKVQTIIYKL